MAHKGSSTKAHHGSAKSAKASSRSKPHSKKHADKSSKSSATGEQVDRFIKDDRDYKSHAVMEYDPCQDEAKRQHEEQLKGVVDKRY
ncbi:hypothetical protein BDZ45DRAFT_670716 [Acephala macrosclerotiorum]|nr:hypothetical protein BDZ45DRAFT_670716 [Acephala macrosclerotiorum]